MGSLLSKDSKQQDDVSVEKSTPTKPILTPNSRISEIDPRSPSTNICRTPIEISGTPSINEFSVNDTFNLNSPAVLNKVLLDPRSPAVEFMRTPIVVPEKKRTTLRNKNFDNVLLNGTPKLTKPILLDITPENQTATHSSKRKSVAGYLETNLDFVETNLDEVILRKSLSNLCTKSDYTPIKSMLSCIDKVSNDDKDLTNSLHKLVTEDEILISITNKEENIAQIQNIMDDIIDEVFKIEDIKIDIIPRIVAISPKPRKIIKSFDKKMKELIYEECKLEASNNILLEEIMSEDKKENQIEIENNTIVLQNSGDIINNDSNDKDANVLDVVPNEENQNTETYTDKIVVKDANINAKEICKTNILQEKGTRSDTNKTRITSYVKEIKNREKTVIKDVENFDVIKRVPLTDRNGSNKNRTIPKLRVHDKPRKCQYSVSKIPQFKGKRFAKLPQTQCENTPPRKNASVWDNEETLVI